MNAMTYREAKSNLAHTMDRVCEDHDPVIITRYKHHPVVIMSLEDYNSKLDFIKKRWENAEKRSTKLSK